MTTLSSCGTRTLENFQLSYQGQQNGELPNASYQSGQLLIGRDERGPYMGVTGNFRYTVAFSFNYVSRPKVKLYANSSRLPLSMTIENLKRSPMELMYLAHVNFRPVDHGCLICSAPGDRQHVRVRSSIPSHIHPPAGYRELKPTRKNITCWNPAWPLTRK